MKIEEISEYNSYTSHEYNNEIYRACFNIMRDIFRSSLYRCLNHNKIIDLDLYAELSIEWLSGWNNFSDTESNEIKSKMKTVTLPLIAERTVEKFNEDNGEFVHNIDSIKWETLQKRTLNMDITYDESLFYNMISGYDTRKIFAAILNAVIKYVNKSREKGELTIMKSTLCTYVIVSCAIEQSRVFNYYEKRIRLLVPDIISKIIEWINMTNGEKTLTLK